jgi:NDP-sugar pyrophosphorylase family protein
LRDNIKSYFGNGSKFGVSLTYVSQEKKNVGTAGALKKFQQFFKSGETFFLIYGDILAEVNYQDMAQFYYRRRNALALMGITTASRPELFGMVTLKGHNIVEFIEKPKKAGHTSHLISAGIYLFNHKIFKLINKKEDTSLEREILPKIVKTNKVSGYMLEGRWFDISTPKVYAQVLKEWR